MGSGAPKGEEFHGQNISDDGSHATVAQLVYLTADIFHILQQVYRLDCSCVADRWHVLRALWLVAYHSDLYKLLNAANKE